MLQIVDQFMQDMKDMIKTFLITVFIVFLLVMLILATFLTGYLFIKLKGARLRPKYLQIDSQQYITPLRPHVLIRTAHKFAPE